MSDGHALPEEPPALTITEVAARTGLSADTLRDDERAGLIERVAATPSGHRSCAASDLGWLDFLIRLRQTGMPIGGTQQYARLRATGDTTVADRLALLRRHKAELDERIRGLLRNAAALDDKIEHYEKPLDRQRGTDGS